MKQYNSEIIAVGTELLLGQIANTNAQWLSNELASYGINVFTHTVVGDNITRVQDTFSAAQKRSNIIIITGGLGPTDDDMTREAFQELTDIELYEDEQSMEKITNYFYDQNRMMTPNNRKQARVFKEAKILQNKTGMAPGMIVHYEGAIWVFLPGVPREMKQIFQDEVLPVLFQTSGQKYMIKSMLLRFIGIGEARLEHELHDLITTQQNPTIAPLAQEDGIVIRLTVKAESNELADKKLLATKNKILDVVGEYFYGINNETIEHKLIQLLHEQGHQISAAESVTGGHFTDKLINVEGASEICPGSVVSYNTNIKKNVLGVSGTTINSQGVVSEQCALEMARNVKSLFKTDIGISFTGVAGPNRLEGQDIGTVFIAISSTFHEDKVMKYVFQGSRTHIKHQATLKGFEQLYKLLNS